VVVLPRLHAAIDTVAGSDVWALNVNVPISPAFVKNPLPAGTEYTDKAVGEVVTAEFDQILPTQYHPAAAA
jgi:hypothetical protein